MPLFSKLKTHKTDSSERLFIELEDTVSKTKETNKQKQNKQKKRDRELVPAT
jgi:hypothetical protein